MSVMPDWLKIALSAALALLSFAAGADWAGFSRFGEVAEVAIEADAIRLHLRIAGSALPAGTSVATGQTTAAPAWLAERLPRMTGADGAALAGTFESLEKIAGATPKDPPAYEARLRYPLNHALDRITLAPPPAATTMGLVALHRGVPVADLLALSQPATLNLDWADPWRSRFADAEFIRRHAEPRSYLYVEPYEVRHEMLLRLADLKPWLDLGLRDPRHVDEDEREALKKKIGAFLLQHNAVRVDGQDATPQLDRVEFVRFSRAGVAPIGEPGHLDTDTLLVGVAIAYLTDNPARAIGLHWDLFGKGQSQRQVSVLQGKDNFDGYATAEHPDFEWSAEDAFDTAAPAPEDSAQTLPQLAVSAADEAPLGIVWAVAAILLAALAVLLFAPHWLRHDYVATALGLLLIAAAGMAFQPRALTEADAAGPDAPQADALLQALLHNAYRAFQLRDEEKAYDRLAKSLDGELLDDIYLQQRRALLRQAEGLGGEGRVDRIEVLDSHIQPGRSAHAMQLAARWMAHGTVSHWGHSHERHNLYQAKLSLRADGGGRWKIVGLEFQGGRRLDAGAAG